MATLGIKGHPIRGREVIQLLEMLGGKNTFHVLGTEYGLVCYIDDKNNIFQMQINDYNPCSNYTIFTLEEFLEKFPYKVGDKVKAWINGYCSICNIRDMEWDSIVNEIKYKIQDYWYSTINLQPYKEETMEERKYADLRLDVDQDDKLATEVTIDGNKITPPKNYLIGKITKVDNGMLIEFVKKQPQYPKDYVECCECLGHNPFSNNVSGYKRDIIESLQTLITCRDAYWKLAGEELGLDKPWEPDWYNLSTPHEFIKINKGYFIYSSRVLVFPTPGMRDAFYKNFKELIEQCKELF